MSGPVSHPVSDPESLNRPQRKSLDIYRSIVACVRQREFDPKEDSEEILALAKWVPSAEKRADAHLAKARKFKLINQCLSSMSILLSGAAGIISVMMEIGQSNEWLGIVLATVSFLSATCTALNINVLNSPGKYQEHMAAESDFTYLAANIAVCLATYDEESGMSDFNSAGAALRHFHVAYTHLIDTSPDA